MGRDRGHHRKGGERAGSRTLAGLAVGGATMLLGLSLSFFGTANLSAASVSPGEDYVVIGWNDLGMHCISPSYQQVALLPPYNNLWAQVIKRGDPPVVVTSGVSLDYSVVNNQTTTGKTDFWQYAGQLFGTVLPEGIGLTGNGLSGTMKLVGDHFEATGIPVLPYDDAMTWNPYQIATVTLRTDAGGTPKTIQVVLPVSDEIHCDMCHMQGGDGTTKLPTDSTSGLTGTMDPDLNILMVHDYYHGQSGTTSIGENLVGAQPVLCARCHSSNALGTPGTPGVKSVSLAMHGWHNGVDRAADATCYSCHPGEITQCLRTSIGGMGYTGDVPSCQSGSCHGGMAGMGNANRVPWVTEPTCEQCHGGNYATGEDLYRHATGHGGLLCAACHNSPHAWWPSKLADDNLQPTTLQHSSASLGDCSICHTRNLDGDNPHVTYYPAEGARLAAGFSDSGLWVYNSGSETWAQVSLVDPENLVYSGTTLYADFGPWGVWAWDDAAWTQLTGADPESVVVSGSALYGDFGDWGLWMWDGAAWSQLTSSDPEGAMVVASSVLYADFGVWGVWAWDGFGWGRITASDSESLTVFGSTLLGDFGSWGIWGWDGLSWSQISSSDPEGVVVSNSTLYADFGYRGVWAWDGASWTQLSGSNPEGLTLSGSTLFGDFGGWGVWTWDGARWSQLTVSDPGSMVSSGATVFGDFDDSGIWRWSGTAWDQISAANPTKMAASD